MNQDVTQSSWLEFSLIEQLARTGDEVDATIELRNQGHCYKQAFERALGLLDLSIVDPRNKGPRFKELTTVRMLLVDYFVGNNEYCETDESLHTYFNDFKCYARKQRESLKTTAQFECRL